MYHVRFQGSHYEMGFKWGDRLFQYGKLLLDNEPFEISEERVDFARQCRPFYERWYPEVLEEIRGIAQGQRTEPESLEAMLLGMYCILPENKCSCFAFRDGEHVILARNSDFLPELEKLNMNCIYRADQGYAFQGNTTAFVEMEDGINDHGLAIGLTSIYPRCLGYGLNAGMLLRYGLEKCSTVREFTEALRHLPIASAQTFTSADRTGSVAVIECNARGMEVCYADEKHKKQSFVSAVNSFHLDGMKGWRTEGVDDWDSEARYETIRKAFEQGDRAEAISFAMDVLSGKYGFICQYDRKTGKDTVWSVVYDVTGGKIYRCEGNPSRRKYREDRRFCF